MSEDANPIIDVTQTSDSQGTNTVTESKTKKPRTYKPGQKPYVSKDGKPHGNAWNPTPEHIAQIRLMAHNGVSEANIARNMGIHPTTFANRKKQLPALNDAIESGKAAGENWLASWLWETVKSPNASIKEKTPLVLFMLKCKYRWTQTDNGSAVVDKVFQGYDIKLIEKKQDPSQLAPQDDPDADVQAETQP